MSAAADLQFVGLTEALELCLLLVEKSPERFGRAALRWHGRYCRELRDVDLDEGPRADSCFGGRGEDDLNGGGGSDDFDGGRGPDTIRGGPGRDFLFGGRGDDLLIGGDGREFEISGGRGADTLRARDGLRERVRGGPGSDRARVDSIDAVRSIETFF